MIKINNMFPLKNTKLKDSLVIILNIESGLSIHDLSLILYISDILSFEAATRPISGNKYKIISNKIISLDINNIIEQERSTFFLDFHGKINTIQTPNITVLSKSDLTSLYLSYYNFKKDNFKLYFHFFNYNNPDLDFSDMILKMNDGQLLINYLTQSH